MQVAAYVRDLLTQSNPRQRSVVRLRAPGPAWPTPRFFFDCPLSGSFSITWSRKAFVRRILRTGCSGAAALAERQAVPR